MAIKSSIEKLRDLLIGEYTLVATVQSVDKIEGTSIVRTESGSILKVRGTSVDAGIKAFIKNGVVVSEAPNVSYYEVEV